VLCLNVIEYLDDPGVVLNSLRDTLKPDGTLLVLVPNGPGLFGSLDQRLGHKRRYSSRDARQLLESHGYSVETLRAFNKAGTPPWWAYGKLFGSRNINKVVLKIFDKTVWFWRRIDALFPWPGLSLIVVGRKNSPIGQPEPCMARSNTAPKYQ
jgi:SAM-dependent methyltransferase